MRNDLPWRAFHQHMAIMQDICPIDKVQGFAHVVVGDQDTDTAVLQMRYQVADFADGDGVDARQRLVQQDEAGARGQG